jgi:hypothetical protein
VLASIVKFSGRSSSDFLPPSPPTQKATARQDQAWETSTGDGAGDGRCNASPFEHNEVTRHSLLDEKNLDFPEPQRIHFTLSRFDNGAETLSRPMCAEGVL